MKLMIGREIWVFLKKEYLTPGGDIFGVLIDVTDDSMYVQCLESGSKVFAIPRENVAYCTISEFPTGTNHIMENKVETEIPQQIEQQAIDSLNVYVNNQQIASIPVPPTFPIHEWNEKILRAIMGNPEVKAELAGKIQKGIEYSPGEVYITIDNVVPPSQMPDENTFQMGGQPTTDFLSPLQMAQRLSKAGSGGNDGQTKM